MKKLLTIFFLISIAYGQSGNSVVIKAGSAPFYDSVKMASVKRLGDTSSTLRSLIGAGSVMNVLGTTNRITSSGGSTPSIDISSTFEGLLGKTGNRIDQNNASTSSSQLAGVISDEVGTGSLVFASGLPVGANPSSSIGLAANNGSNSTFMRSDASPALSQSITPTWTNLHTFTGGLSATGAKITTPPSGSSADSLISWKTSDGTLQKRRPEDLGLSRRIISSNVQLVNTATTTENTVYTGTIPAYSIGANGSYEIHALWSYPNSANNKTLRCRFNGVTVMQAINTTSASNRWIGWIFNRNSLQVQASAGSGGGLSQGGGTSGTALSSYTFDETADIAVTLTIQNATGSEGTTTALEGFEIVVYP